MLRYMALPLEIRSARTYHAGMRALFSVSMIMGLAAVMTLAGCASVPGVPDEQTLRLNALMDEIADGYAETSHCLSKQQYRHVTIIDEQHLLFRGGANKAWLNKLRNPCRGLRRNDALLFELHGSGACDMDRVSVIDTSLGGQRAGPSCSLGEFKRIPRNYVERIEALLRND